MKPGHHPSGICPCCEGPPEDERTDAEILAEAQDRLATAEETIRRIRAWTRDKYARDEADKYLRDDDE